MDQRINLGGEREAVHRAHGGKDLEGGREDLEAAAQREAHLEHLEAHIDRRVDGRRALRLKVDAPVFASREPNMRNSFSTDSLVRQLLTGTNFFLFAVG